LRIAGSCTLPFDCEKTYRSLHDPAILARCLQGCDDFQQIGPDEYALNMNVSLAAFSGPFSGRIKTTEANPPHSFKIFVEGDVVFGFLKGEGFMRLTPSPQGAELAYDGDVQVGGTIASLGQRIIDSTAKMMIRKFFDKFIEEINQDALH
jgi:carbon monoxide dehydrogenase subunit G